MYYPYNPRTPEQQAWRQGMYNAIRNWKVFNQPSKAYYNALVAPKASDGFRRYVKMYLRQFDATIHTWSDSKVEWSDDKVTWSGFSL